MQILRILRTSYKGRLGFKFTAVVVFAETNFTVPLSQQGLKSLTTRKLIKDSITIEIFLTRVRGI